MLTRLRIKFYDLLNDYHIKMMCKYMDYPSVKEYHDKRADYYWNKCIELSSKKVKEESMH